MVSITVKEIDKDKGKGYYIYNLFNYNKDI